MKQPNYKKTTGLLFLCCLLTPLLIFTGCELTQLGNARGIVLNADTGEGLSGAVVELTRLSSSYPTADATTDSFGRYTFTAVPVGVYELSARYGSYKFTKEIVEITWSDARTNTLPNVAGFLPNAPVGSVPLKIITLWDNDYMNVNAYLTLPNEYSSNYPGVGVTFSSFWFDGELFTDFNVPLDPPEGFSPENPGTIGTSTNSSIDRINLFNGYTQYNVSPVTIAEMNNDGRDGGGPETITVYWPVDNGTSAISYHSDGPGDPSGLPEGNYAFTGVLEYYLKAHHATDPGNTVGDNSLLSSSNTSFTANPRVFIFSDGTLVGYYVLPDYTDIKSASIFRVNCFYGLDAGNNIGYFQIIPDIALAWAPRSAHSEDKGIITVPGTTGARP